MNLDTLSAKLCKKCVPKCLFRRCGTQIFLFLKGFVFFLMFSEPCGLVPKFFKRTSLMISEPPVAEDELDDDESCTHQEACSMTAMSEETEAPVVENQTSYDRLRQVVREAHLSVRSYLYEPVFRACLIVCEGNSGHDHEHHAEVLPHVEHDLETV